MQVGFMLGDVVLDRGSLLFYSGLWTEIN